MVPAFQWRAISTNLPKEHGAMRGQNWSNRANRANRANIANREKKADQTRGAGRTGRPAAVGGAARVCGKLECQQPNRGPSAMFGYTNPTTGSELGVGPLAFSSIILALPAVLLVEYMDVLAKP